MRKVPDLTEKEKVDVNAHIAECDWVEIFRATENRRKDVREG